MATTTKFYNIGLISGCIGGTKPCVDANVVASTLSTLPLTKNSKYYSSDIKNFTTLRLVYNESSVTPPILFDEQITLEAIGKKTLYITTDYKDCLMIRDFDDAIFQLYCQPDSILGMQIFKCNNDRSIIVSPSYFSEITFVDNTHLLQVIELAGVCKAIIGI